MQSQVDASPAALPDLQEYAQFQEYAAPVDKVFGSVRYITKTDYELPKLNSFDQMVVDSAIFK